MLYHLLYEFLYRGFSDYWAPLKIFNVFQYITFRTAYATLTALVLSLVLGPWLINRLREFHIGQHIREEGPKSHQAKAGTPTMGGVLIVLTIVVSTLLFADLRNPYVWLLTGATLAYGAVGFADDYLKIRKKHNRGLTGREKIGLQILVSVLIGMFLLLLATSNRYSTKLTVPF